MLGGKLFGAWGLTWDIQWHLLIGRDSFWIAPHLMMYGGITAGLLVASGVLALDTAAARRGPRPRGAFTIVGVTSTRGMHLAAWLTAFRHGGVAFHAFAILGALLLPLVFLPAARLLDRRWTPVAVVVVALGVSLLAQLPRPRERSASISRSYAAVE